jgi:ParB family chromosome partitioning protein
MKIVYKDIDELTEYENNPRIITELAVDKMADSIKNFGFNNPILLDKNNVIIAGHLRMQGAIKAGLKTLPCIYADDMSPEEVDAFRIEENKSREGSTWDFGKLKDELDGLKEQGVNIEDSGFGEFEAMSIMNDWLPDQPNDEEEEEYKELEDEANENDLTAKRIVIYYKQDDYNKMQEILKTDKVKRLTRAEELMVRYYGE